jgi:hypothetical protein
VNIFLEVGARLGGADAGEILHRGLEKFGNVVLNLFAEAWISQGLAQIGLLDMGESAT